MKIIRIRAVWCMSCLVMNKRYAKIQKQYPGLQTIDYDFDTEASQFERYQIGTTLPVFLQVDSEGNELRRLVGEKSDKELLYWIEEGQK